MFYPNPRNRKLSKDLRKLVCESIGYQKQRFSWDGIDTRTDKRKNFNKPENIGKRLSEFQGETKHSWQEHSAVLGSRKSEMLAAILLERLQDFTATALQIPIHNEQGNRVCHRRQGLFDTRS